MRIKLTPYAQREWDKLVRSDRKLALKVEELMREVAADPYFGKGKLEPLKDELAGFRSRRINRKDRLVYRIDEEAGVVNVVSMMSHYGSAEGSGAGE